MSELCQSPATQASRKMHNQGKWLRTGVSPVWTRLMACRAGNPPDTGATVKSKSRYQLVMVTAPLLPVARKLAEKILTARLAACINVVPGLESHFWWKGKRNSCREVLLLIKTTSDRLKPLRRLVKNHHPYDTPEFIALPIESGSKKYLKWLESSVA